MKASSQNFIRCAKTGLHRGTRDHNPLVWDGPTFQGGTRAPRNRLQHKLLPFLLGCTRLHRHIVMSTTITGAHMAWCLHELSMSTQKATEAGITGWDNRGTKERTPRDGGNLHPLTNLPTGNFPVPPHSPIPLPAHTSLPVLQLLQVGYTGPVVPVDPIPPPRERPGHAAAPRRCPSPVGLAGSPNSPEKRPPRAGSPCPEGRAA